MSKTIVLGAVAATAVVAATVPTAILYGGSSKSGTTKEYIPQLSSAEDIKNKYSQVGCLKSYFGTITFGGTKAKPLQSNQISNFTSNSQSCLLVEYNKKTYEGNKWHGEFRLIWAIKNDNQGVITVTNAKTDTSKGELRGNSAAYILNKDTSNNSWTTPHIQEIIETKKNADQGLKNLIPQASESLPNHPDTTKYWGFDPNIDNICKKEECKETEVDTIHKSYSWELIGSNEESTISSWTPNIREWLRVIFAWEELANKINAIKGKWQERIDWSR